MGRISNRPQVGPLTGSEILAAVQGGETRRVTLAQLASWGVALGQQGAATIAALMAILQAETGATEIGYGEISVADALNARATLEALDALDGSELVRDATGETIAQELVLLRQRAAALEGAQAGAGIAFATKALLDAQLGYAPYTKAEVYADGANNGVYAKAGALGAGNWNKIANLAITGVDLRTTTLEERQHIGLFTAATSLDGNVITLNSPTGNHIWNPGCIYRFKPLYDATAATPQASLDGQGAIGFYGRGVEGLPLGTIRQYNEMLFVFRPGFGGYLALLDYIPPPGSAEVWRALRGFQEAKDAIVPLYRHSFPAPASWQTLYENTFDSQADCNHGLVFHGSNDRNLQGSGTYDALIYSAANGGFGRSNCDILGGLQSDGNHRVPGPGIINLLGVFNFANNGGSLPNIADLRNLRITLRLRATALFLPPETRLALHFQSTTAGPARAFNYIYTKDLVDDAMGFGGHGLGMPHYRPTALTTGFIDFVADFAPSDAFFHCLAGSVSRVIDGTYRAAPVAWAMQQTVRNMMVVALHPQQAGDLFNPIQRVTGALDFQRLLIEGAA